MLAYGFVRWFFGWEGAPARATPAGDPGPHDLPGAPRLRSGCAALTGVEAVSDGVPAFHPPRSAQRAHRARLARHHPGHPVHGHHLPRPALSLLPRTAGDGGLAARPPDLRRRPPLLRDPGRDHADPGLRGQHRRSPTSRGCRTSSPATGSSRASSAPAGDRLVFSNGILILGGLAALLIVLFGGDTHALIPLYAVGVFLSFTLSQASMVRRWLARREEGWWWRWWLNAVGAATTGLVMLVIAGTKFSRRRVDGRAADPAAGALIFMMIHRHYADVARQLSLEGYGGPPPIEHSVLVLVGDLHRGVAAALRYAQTLSPSVEGGLRRGRPRPDAEARGEVGQVRARHPARGADLALPVAAHALPRLRQPPPRAGRRTTWSRS